MTNKCPGCKLLKLAAKESCTQCEWNSVNHVYRIKDIGRVRDIYQKVPCEITTHHYQIHIKLVSPAD